MIRLTVAQALVRFLVAQHTERDGESRRLFAGCFGIFGHGNVAGLGQALWENRDLTYYQARNEQAMVHTAAAYARMSDRLSTFACTSSVGPGATNMITAAAGATINRLPVLLLPGDTFATRVAEPVLQQLEMPWAGDVTVNDAFRPVSRYFDRIARPEQLIGAALAAVRTLTDPVDTGAVTLALPQDVQAEAFDWPEEFLAHRVWRIDRPAPQTEVLDDAVRMIRDARRPLVVAGGGVVYAGATEALDAFARATGIPVAETQAGKGSLRHGHPCAAGAVGHTGTTAADALAREADLVIGIGTRYSDFTTASHTQFADPGVRFLNINVARPDAVKHAGLAMVADARTALEALTAALAGWQVPQEHRARTVALARDWDAAVDAAHHLGHTPKPAQSEVVGAVNEAAGEDGVVICAAGSLPGDLHKLWRSADPKQYHVEYGYSCMGYEIAGGLGVKLAAPEREVFVMVGDGSYLMMAQELVTAVAEGVKLIVVLVQNHGYASIGALSETVGAPRFGTWYRYRDADSGALEGDRLPVDLAANAASLGADVLRVATIAELRKALAEARASDRCTVIHIETDPMVPAPSSGAWWDVPVAEVSDTPETRAAREAYVKAKSVQRPYL
ncbi:3D-(3,5/4)-trihydroxycyclohexane-1,2-dione acylhydrolase (decyclizing) [Streptomyces poriferorum]|uniref:3D-(3,5/4)-trihydroxycyclohexane-1,2-dione acylhydrolase (Decyclizing) n=1 Tax=Streptomyces poriferorum TaxID=2798799 RepID=A0ABY9ISL8_9ACTN|nr:MULTISPECIES: 3D-(3,5/4)-trihydroxycyclohexane-1,2-dione acylhydrolase (decyclizing) [unclassified Streptomyces]MDP5312671.1 3D-(3,5/4)-trihydroxycyclohexane-1,2-dione acylhydrolase (decyclizing) [Streptomyces sp. Alt4]WLQ58307.1 3D-(3,5/4)-trihydroxycyclohexane-1,2-dione acylhydrolase (decyclizing) [Streptomyces sp. Alt2]